MIRKYQPKTFFEIGTCAGVGTNIIANAIKKYQPLASVSSRGVNVKVADVLWSMDLPPQEEYKSEQYSGGDVGAACKFPFTQIRCDSMEYDYSQTPCEGWFVDGEHDHKHVNHETLQILKQQPKLIVWHDTDIPEVLRGIRDYLPDRNYDLFRVTDTRISYAVRK